MSALTNLVDIGEGIRAVACKDTGLSVDKIDVSEPEDMRRQLVGHVRGGDTEGSLVVRAAAEEVLAIVRSGSTLPSATGSVAGKACGIVGLIEEEPVKIKATLILPEIRILVAEHHHGSLAAVVSVFPVLGILSRGHTESVLKIDGNTFPTTPEVTELAETGDSHIALD